MKISPMPVVTSDFSYVFVRIVGLWLRVDFFKVFRRCKCVCPEFFRVVSAVYYGVVRWVISLSVRLAIQKSMKFIKNFFAFDPISNDSNQKTNIQRQARKKYFTFHAKTPVRNFLNSNFNFRDASRKLTR